jgi:hypothetical protein
MTVDGREVEAKVASLRDGRRRNTLADDLLAAGQMVTNAEQVGAADPRPPR